MLINTTTNDFIEPIDPLHMSSIDAIRKIRTDVFNAKMNASRWTLGASTRGAPKSMIGLYEYMPDPRKNSEVTDVKNITQYNYGEAWDFLKSRGWKITPSERKVGTAACDGPNKQILVRPFVYKVPNTRVIKYVMPHEIWHALHYELRQYECDKVRLDLVLSWKSAIEVVADGGCLLQNGSRTMRAWVRSSVAWHGRVGYDYKWRHVVDPSVAEFCSGLIEEMRSAARVTN